MTERGAHNAGTASDEDYFEAVTPAPPERQRTPDGAGPPQGEGRPRPPVWVRVIGIGLVACIALLLVCGVATGVLAILAYTTPAATATTTQSFAVAGVPTVVVHGEAGDVSVSTGSADQVTMRVTKSVRAITTGLAQAALNDMRITATQAGDTITIEEQLPSYGVSFMERNFQLELTVPDTANLTANINAGTLTATGLQGTLGVETNAGTVVVRDAQLRDASLHTNAGSMLLQHVTLSGNASLGSNAGSIDLDGALAPNTTLGVHVNSGSVSLALPVATSAHLDAATTVGDIRIAGWPIAVQHGVAHATAIGDLTPNPTGSIIIRADAGSVSVTAS